MNRRNVVLWRGYVPCELLIIGEAPGTMEDHDGYPFTGPAGGILDAILQQVIIHLGRPFTYAITNMVACIPLDDSHNIRPPEETEISACFPRLTEFIQIAHPNVICTAGEVAGTSDPATLATFPVEWANITHPAAIVRKDWAYQSAAILKQVSVIVNAIERATQRRLEGKG